MKRGWKILIGVVLALGVAYALLLLVSHDNVRDKVAAYKKELRAKGEKLTFAELAPPPSTKTPNGAKAFMDASNLLSSSYVDHPPMMHLIAPGVARIGHTNIAAELMFNYASNVQKTVELRTILTNAAVLDFNLHYSDSIYVPGPNRWPLSYVVVLAGGTAVQALYKRDYPEAWRDLCAAVDLVRLFDNEPLGHSQIVRLVMTRTAVAAGWEALQENHWKDEQLSQLQLKLETTDLLSLMEPCMAIERAYAVEGLATLRNSPEIAVRGMMFSGEGTGGVAGGWMDNVRQKLRELYNVFPRYWRWKASWSYEEELYDLQIATAGVEASRRIKAMGAFVPTFNEFHRQATNIDKMYPDGTNHFVLPNLIGYGPDFERYFTLYAEAETARRLLVTVLALKRYHLQHGVYPANLTELVPDYLKQMPMDFMDGKPLRYRLRPDGDFLLYSVGEDGEDNGGDPSPVGNGTINNWLAARDIVWPRAATAAEIEKYEGHSGTETNAPAK